MVSRKSSVERVEDELKKIKIELKLNKNLLELQQKQDKGLTIGGKRLKKHQTDLVDRLTNLKISMDYNYKSTESVKDINKDMSSYLSKLLRIEERKIAMGKVGKNQTKMDEYTGGANKTSEKSTYRKIQQAMSKAKGLLSPPKEGGQSQNPMAKAMKSAMKFAIGGSILGLVSKKLIDSSPMLQAMMKIFNTSIMLIFRPIGDFIGGFLRPMLFFFMQNIAIPFYKKFKDASKFGNDIGKKVLGFFLKPVETISAAIIAATGDAASKRYSGVEDWQLEQAQNELKQLYNYPEQTDMWKEIQYRRKNNLYGELTPEQAMAAGGGIYASQGKTTAGEIFGVLGGAGGLASKSGVGGESFELIRSEAEISASWMEDVSDLFENVKNSGEVTADDAAEFQRLVAETALHGQGASKSMEYLYSMLDQLSEKVAAQLKSVGMTMKRPDGRMTGQGRTFVGASSVLSSLLDVEDQTHNWGMGGVPKPTIAPVVSALDTAAAGWESNYLNILPNKPNTNPRPDYELLKKAKTATDDEGNLIIDNRTLEEKLKAENYNPDGSLKTWMDYASDPKVASEWMSTSATENLLHNSGVQIGMANGGIINEEIFGVGRSGKRYRFGEAGTEIVTPTGNGGGATHVVNINIGNVSREADYAKLKPLIQRWILETNSRRGVV